MYFSCSFFNDPWPAFMLKMIVNRLKGRRGRDRMVDGFTTTCAISAYHHYSCEFEPRSWRGILHTILCDNVCQWLAAGRWFSPSTSTNKIDCCYITEILLKVAWNTINQPTNRSTTAWLRISKQKSIYSHFLPVRIMSRRHASSISLSHVWIYISTCVRELIGVYNETYKSRLTTEDLAVF